MTDDIKFDLKDVFLMLGEKDVIIFQLGKRVDELVVLNQTAAEHLSKLLAENEELRREPGVPTEEKG